MAIALFSLLFALVVAGRPVLQDAERTDLAPTTFQTAIQAPFRIHPGQDDSKHDPARFQAQKPKPQISYLSELDAENIAAVASLQISPTALDEADAPATHNELDDPSLDRKLAAPEPAPLSDTPGAPLVALAFSCVAALLALACVMLTLSVISRLQSRMLASRRAWELLPRFWSRPRSSVPQEDVGITTKSCLLGGAHLVLQTDVEQQRLLHAEEGSAERHDTHTEDKPLYFDAISDTESDSDDVDEKYQDALDTTPLAPTHDLALDPHVSPHSHLGNAPPPSSVSHPPDQPRNDRSAPLMRDVGLARPAWSVRAIDSPALGLSAHEGGGADSTAQPLVHPRRRAYRSVVPEFDVALAMQLRPGLGIGADSAWMVRFLMTIFGWFAVALTSNGTR